MTLLFYVNNQSLALNPSQRGITVASDSRNYLKAKFVFKSKEWQKAVGIYALFSYGGQTYKKYLGVEKGLQSNECYVPPEVIKSGKFTVSIFCENRITTNMVEIPVQNSGYTEKITNQNATPTVMQQMDALMYKYAMVCNDILKECQKIEKGVKEEK